MTSEYIARPLPKDQVLQAFPLVQALDSRLTPQSWRRFAEASFDHHNRGDYGRIMTLQTSSGYIHALFVYWVREDLRDGRQMDVDHLVTFELPGQTKAITTALRVMEQLGREQSCGVININVPHRMVDGPEGPSSLAATFGNIGYSEYAARWRKEL
jgi:hypothetical protein